MFEMRTLIAVIPYKSATIVFPSCFRGGGGMVPVLRNNPKLKREYFSQNFQTVKVKVIM